MTSQKARRQLPPEAKLLRRELLYSNGVLPTEGDKQLAFQRIKAIPGADWYPMKAHRNWCYRVEESLRLRSTTQLGRSTADCGSPDSQNAPQINDHPNKMEYTALYGYVEMLLQSSPNPSFLTLMQWAQEAHVPTSTICDIVEELLVYARSQPTVVNHVADDLDDLPLTW